MKMRYPNSYTPEQIRQWHVEEEFKPGQWRLARECECITGGLIRRLKMAIGVFTGKYDILFWGEKSGELPNDQINYRDITDIDFGKHETKTSS